MAGRKRRRNGSIVSRKTPKASEQNAEEFVLSPAAVCFMDLPPELQATIFGNLPATSIKSSRLVCRHWRNVIDTTQTFYVVINDVKQGFNQKVFPRWKIDKCFVGSYVTKYLRQQNFLKYPNKLRIFSVWGEITPDNFWYILNQSGNLEELHFAKQAFSSLLFETPMRQPVNLDFLRKLTVLEHNDGMAELPIIKNMIGLFSLDLPNLIKLKLQFPEDDRIYEGLYPELRAIMNVKAVEFIAKNKKIKIIDISFGAIPFPISQSHLNQAVAQLRSKVDLANDLSQLRLTICRLDIPASTMSLLTDMFACQRNLKEIKLLVPSSSRIGHQLSYASLENSIRGSISTLVSIHISWLSDSPNRIQNVVDFSIFLEAHNLKFLKMDWHSFGEQFTNIEVKNLQMLPPSLETLSLHGFFLKSNEVKLMANDRTLENLAKIHLTDAGRQNPYGINSSTAMALCRKDSLSDLRIGPLTVGGDLQYEALRSKYSNKHFQPGSTVSINIGRWKKKNKQYPSV